MDFYYKNNVFETLDEIIKSEKNYRTRILLNNLGRDYFVQVSESCYSDVNSLEQLGYYIDYQGTIRKGDLKNLSKPISKYIKFDNTHEQSKTTHLTTNGLKYTFGVELETSRGLLIPNHYWGYDLNLKCEYDGSLKDEDGADYGGEYITGVLSGDEGLKNISNICAVLSQRCLIDKRAGIHVHVGGFNNSKFFAVAAYLLATKIQNELFELVAPSRRKNETCGHLQDHSQLIFNNIEKYGFEYGVKKSYEELGRFMANQRPLNKTVNKKKEHPGGRYTDRYGGHGLASIQNIKNLYRYKVINLIPVFFNTRGVVTNNIKEIPYTLEFRNHQASLNFEKIKNWILLCMAFVYFCENHQKEIFSKDPITIEDLIIKAYGNRKVMSKKLLIYFDQRKEKFKTDILLEEKEYSELTEKSLSCMEIVNEIKN